MNMSKTRSDLNVWNKWCATIEKSRIFLLELNRLLSHFFVSLKKKNGEDYEPNSLTAFQKSIDRHLRGCRSEYYNAFNTTVRISNIE